MIAGIAPSNDANVVSNISNKSSKSTIFNAQLALLGANKL